VNNGGLAFPCQGRSGLVENEGMSLRDYFAGQALEGLTGVTPVGEFETLEQLHKLCAETCYKLADAMIAERDKTKGR